MKRQIVRQGFDVLFDHMVTRHSHRPCWVLNKNRKLSLVEANKYFICTLGDSLAERRLQGAKRSDSVRFVDGHSKVVDRCLEVFSTDHWLDRAESEWVYMPSLLHCDFIDFPGPHFLMHENTGQNICHMSHLEAPQYWTPWRSMNVRRSEINSLWMIFKPLRPG